MGEGMQGKHMFSGHGPEAPNLDVAALSEEIPQGFFPKFILCHSFIQHIFERHAVKNRDRESPRTHPHSQKRHILLAQLLPWATHRFPWDKMGPWGDCRAHHSNGQM